MPAESERDRLIATFRKALAAVRGARLAQAALSGSDVRHVIALGKAAESLAAGAWRATGGAIGSGFIACPDGYGSGELPAEAPFVRHIGGHPLPDAASLAAGTALVRYVRGLPPDAPVAVLLSGGASACIEWPRRGVDLALLRRANAWLLASGLPIAAMNRIRLRLSQLKGGGLARLLAGHEAVGFVLVDVPGDGMDWVGGAPLAAPPPGPLAEELPEWLRAHLGAEHDAPRVMLHRLAGNEEAVAAVTAQGGAAAGVLEGEVNTAAAMVAEHLRQAAPGDYVWGGEVGVRLPAQPGRGGRCRHLALHVAARLAGRSDWRLLAGASDGWDGNDAVAGACVDGGTLARGAAAGLDAGEALEHANSGAFLAATGDEFKTGATGTNVNDLVIAAKR